MKASKENLVSQMSTITAAEVPDSSEVSGAEAEANGSSQDEDDVRSVDDDIWTQLRTEMATMDHRHLRMQLE